MQATRSLFSVGVGILACPSGVFDFFTATSTARPRPRSFFFLHFSATFLLLSPHRHPAFPLRRVVNDACATQAILSILLNSPSLSLGTELTQFQDFVKELPPDMAGMSIGSSELLRTAHNSFSASHGILPDAPPPGAEGEAFHFVAYIPIAGGVYEMDGTKDGPVRRAEAPNGEGWAALAAEEIKRRIALVEASGNIQFNLMALVRDRRDALNEEIDAAKARVAAVEAAGEEAAVERAQVERCDGSGAIRGPLRM